MRKLEQTTVELVQDDNSHTTFHMFGPDDRVPTTWLIDITSDARCCAHLQLALKPARTSHKPPGLIVSV
jgi:hypothetical protein